MNKVQTLIEDIFTARSQYLASISAVTEEQAHWKPDAETWNMCEITEHLFWAEQGALYGMWKTLYAIREGSVKRETESIHKDFPIEHIIEKTWQVKEKVPPVAAPKLGGTLAFWKSSLQHLHNVLVDFGQDLQDDELRLQAHPHPISGVMDFQQRLEFLRFHIDRHRLQVLELLHTMP